MLYGRAQWEMEGLRGKHGGSQFLALKNLGKFFPRGLFLVTSGTRPSSRTCRE